MKRMVELKGRIMLLFAFLSIAGSLTSQAQNSDEWLRPKQTQLEYLLLQITALEINSELISKGSQIMELGLEGISSWKDLEKSFHGDFFDSHRNLGPLARKDLSRLENGELNPEELRRAILDSQLHWEKQISSPDEVFSLWSRGVHQEMLEKCGKLDSYSQSLRSQNLEMEDADRSAGFKLLVDELEKLRSDFIRIQILAKHRQELTRERSQLIQHQQTIRQ